MLEAAVIQSSHDNMVCCILGVGDRNLARVARHLEVTVYRHFLDSGSEGSRGLLREVLGSVETSCVGVWMEDRYCQGLDFDHHLVLSYQGPRTRDHGFLSLSIEGHLVLTKWHREP